jgi:crotonobetainyl-CoA:carnitine CoA-transferase CaiB-like acyl-CoA transferase
MLAYRLDSTTLGRNGNEDTSGRARLHDAFRCAGDDRWVAIAAWDDEDLERLVKVAGDDVARWCADRAPLEVVEILQGAGVEAVPVQDFADCHSDPQLAHRSHFVRLTHPYLGEGHFERNGFRLSDGDGGYRRSAPTLGQDNAFALGEILGLSPAEQAETEAEGALK